MTSCRSACTTGNVHAAAAAGCSGALLQSALFLRHALARGAPEFKCFSSLHRDRSLIYATLQVGLKSCLQQLLQAAQVLSCDMCPCSAMLCCSSPAGAQQFQKWRRLCVGTVCQAGHLQIRNLSQLHAYVDASLFGSQIEQTLVNITSV